MSDGDDKGTANKKNNNLTVVLWVTMAKSSDGRHHLSFEEKVIVDKVLFDE